MLRRIFAGLVVTVVMAGGVATAENLTLSGDDWWVQVASRQDLSIAIELARTYAALKSRVVKARNGRFVVVLGPYADSDVKNFREKYKSPALPKDAFLKRGADYIETMWQPPSATPPGGLLTDWTEEQVCRAALNGPKYDWDIESSGYGAYVAEAKRRNLSVDDCRVAIGLSRLQSSVAAGKRVEELCALALDNTEEGWEARYADYVAEAQHRNLSVDDCRVAIGLPSLSSPAGRPVKDLCNLALDIARDDWDTKSEYADYVTEAKRRNVSIDDCRAAIGASARRAASKRSAVSGLVTHSLRSPSERRLTSRVGF